MSRSHALPNRFVDVALTDELGREVVKIEALALQPGQTIRLIFERADSPLRQGVWFGVNGLLRVNEDASSQVRIWADSAPPEVRIACEASDGLVHFYNFWCTPDSAAAPGTVFSLFGNSGMLVDELSDGWRRYSCGHSDVGVDYERLVFRIAVM